MLFMAYCTDDGEKPDLRAKTRPAHVEWLKANGDTIKAAGPVSARRRRKTGRFPAHPGRRKP